MKEIKLTRDQVALVDDEDYEFLSQWKWFAHWNTCTKSFYALRTQYCPQKTIYMQREIMNTPKGLICDHINHDTLDNQKHNLRNATKSENGMNRKNANSNNEFGRKNITPYRSGFRVRLFKDGKEIFHKTYKTLQDAVIARDNAVQRFHGEFGS